MATLLLVGSSGWNQRWEIAPGKDDAVAAELDKVGTENVGRLQLLNLETDSEVTLVVAWKFVATAVIIPSPAVDHQRPGQYA